MSIGETSRSESSFRFEALKSIDSPAPEPSAAEPAAAEPQQVLERGRYADLEDSHDRVAARMETQAEFGTGIRDAVTERFGAAKDAPSEPMQLDSPSRETLQQPASRQGGTVQETPFGPMLNRSREQEPEHASGKRPPFYEDRSGAEIEKEPEKERAGGMQVKTLSFYEDQRRAQGHDLER